MKRAYWLPVLLMAGAVFAQNAGLARSLSGTWDVVRTHEGCCGYKATHQLTFTPKGAGLTIRSSDGAFDGGISRKASGKSVDFTYGQGATLSVTVDGEKLKGNFSDGKHHGSIAGTRVK